MTTWPMFYSLFSRLTWQMRGSNTSGTVVAIATVKLFNSIWSWMEVIWSPLLKVEFALILFRAAEFLSTVITLSTSTSWIQ
jgi:hypothetical protein